MSLYVTDRLKRLLFEMLLYFGASPAYAVKSSVLKFKLEGELSPICEKSGIRLEALQRQETWVWTTPLIECSGNRSRI